LNALYVDKTELIYRLANHSKYVFLSRPRRFGKSLLSSTLRYYFEGRKDLFTGLAMERLEKEWIEYPVLRFDLSTLKGVPADDLNRALNLKMTDYEEIYGRNQLEVTACERLTGLIKRAFNKTGKRVVVLIDEYDAPMLEVLHSQSELEAVRKVMRDFYSPLKACDDYLRFVFLTGISMFSQLSIFSELNNLEIISRSEEYASICGITKQELVDNFQYGIKKMAADLSCTEDEVLVKLKDRYDGYHFSKNSEGVFNPFSLLNAFKRRELGSYWFASGTPRALVEMLKKYKRDGKFDVEMLDNLEPVSPAKFETPLEMQTGPLPLLYQAGYVTIKNYDEDASVFVLGVPNSEVRVGLMENLLPLYADVESIDVSSVTLRASAALRKGDIDKAMQLFQSMLASIPFMRGDKDILADAEKTEAFYHRIFFFFFHMLNNEVYAELRSSKGAADVVITTPKYIYIVEIKIDASADTALQQIEEKGYATPYLADGRQIVKLGISFSTDTRTVTDWRTA
jgi:AcrR family transcriptional regulator